MACLIENPVTRGIINKIKWQLFFHDFQRICNDICHEDFKNRKKNYSKVQKSDWSVKRELINKNSDKFDIYFRKKFNLKIIINEMQIENQII